MLKSTVQLQLECCLQLWFYLISQCEVHLRCREASGATKIGNDSQMKGQLRETDTCSTMAAIEENQRSSCSLFLVFKTKEFLPAICGLLWYSLSQGTPTRWECRWWVWAIRVFISEVLALPNYGEIGGLRNMTAFAFLKHST